mgnify:FL=1
MVIFNILEGWFRKIFCRLTNEERDRLLKCKACLHKTKVLNMEVCTMCGCFIDAKVRSKKEKCLLNKW